MKRFPKKRGLSKPAVPQRKNAASARGKAAAVTERGGGENRAKTKVRLDVALVERGLLEIDISHLPDLVIETAIIATTPAARGLPRCRGPASRARDARGPASPSP